jgi:hypothetical protein
VCGWIAGTLVLASIGALFVGFFQHTAALAIVAVACLVAAAVLYRVVGSNELFLQLALAVSMTGQLSAAAALLKWFPHSEAAVALALAGLQCLLVAVMPNAVHRFLSALFAVGALAFAAYDLHAWSYLLAFVSTFAVAVWLSEARWQCAGWGELWRPVAYALCISVLCLPGFVPDGLMHELTGKPAVDSRVAIAWAPAWALLVRRLTAKVALVPRAAAAAAALGLVVLAAYAPGVTASALIVLLGFSVGSRLLVGMALLAAVTYLGFFYYQMQLTLLLKAAALAAAGVGCWLVWWVVYWLAKDARS